MPRPTKCRRVEFFPENTYFIPSDKDEGQIEEVTLKIEELEAMRLKDILGLNQEECAEKMEVSRQTFQNIIDSARKKVASALTSGKAINISGGHYIMKSCEMKCLKCESVYKARYNSDKFTCPQCGGEEILCTKKNKICHKWCEK